LFLGQDGFVLDKPLLLPGNLDVGATLTTLLARLQSLEQANAELQANMTATEARVQQQSSLLTELQQRNVALNATVVAQSTFLSGLAQFEIDTTNTLGSQADMLAEHSSLLAAITAVNSSNLAAMQVVEENMAKQLASLQTSVQGNSIASLQRNRWPPVPLR
jgi:chromosome segregation ATPase